MMLPREKFRTITGPDWVRALRAARQRRQEAKQRIRDRAGAPAHSPALEKLADQLDAAGLYWSEKTNDNE